MQQRQLQHWERLSVSRKSSQYLSCSAEYKFVCICVSGSISGNAVTSSQAFHYVHYSAFDLCSRDLVSEISFRLFTQALCYSAMIRVISKQLRYSHHWLQNLVLPESRMQNVCTITSISAPPFLFHRCKQHRSPATNYCTESFGSQQTH